MNGLVIFDLDGTLIDTPSAIVEAFQKVFMLMNEEKKEFLTIRNTIGLSLENAFGLLLGVSSDSKQIPQAIDLYQEVFRNSILPKAKELIYPGIQEGLSLLQDADYTLAIATSKYYKSADILLESAGLRDRFKLLVGADQVKKPKPDTEMGAKIMNHFGVSFEDTVMVGDTTHDIKMANDLGMTSIAVSYGVHSYEKLIIEKPTWIVDNFSDAINHINKYSFENE